METCEGLTDARKEWPALRLTVTGAERLESIARLHEDGQRDRSDEAHEAVKAEACAGEDKDVLLFFERRDERSVVGESKVLEATAHEVHRALREEGVEAGDLGQASEELLSDVGEGDHRLEEEGFGSVGEQLGESTLHRRAGSLEIYRRWASRPPNAQEC